MSARYRTIVADPPWPGGSRFPIECDCVYPMHLICSECGDDWEDCECGALLADDEECQANNGVRAC